MEMSTLQLRSVPESLKRDLRRRARARGQTMSDYVLELIRRDLSLPTWEQWFDELKKLPPVHGLKAADLLAEAREEAGRD